MRWLLLIITLLNYSTVFGTSFTCSLTDNGIILKGTVLNEHAEPVPYVNIGIVGKGVGTVSDEDGNFLLKIPSALQSEPVLFSSIGYENYVLPLKEIADWSNIKIQLLAKTTHLQQVIVKPMKTKILGNTTTSKIMNAGYVSHDLGAEAGLKIKIKHRPAFIENVNFNISYNDFDTLTFRLNIYTLKDGLPSENILHENVIYKLVNKQTGKISLDLSSYNLEVNDDILVALEIIECAGGTKGGVLMSASLLGGPIYYRKNSQDKWKIVKGMGVGINVEARY